MSKHTVRYERLPRGSTLLHRHIYLEDGDIIEIMETRKRRPPFVKRTYREWKRCGVFAPFGMDSMGLSL